MEGRGGATWSITVGGPPGLEGREEEGRFVSVLGGGGVPQMVLSSPGLVAGQCREGRPGLLAATAPSLGMRVQLLRHGWAVRSKGKTFPKAPGGWCWEEEVGFLPPHSGRSGCRVSRRQSVVSKTMTKTHS